MAAVIDVDGTLIDSNYQHVLAWQRAFAAAGFHVPCARIHRTIGIGSDRFVAAACDEAAEREHGDALRDAHSEQYEKLIDEAGPLPDAHELLAALRERDVAVVLARPRARSSTATSSSWTPPSSSRPPSQPATSTRPSRRPT